MQLLEKKNRNDHATRDKIMAWTQEKQANEQAMLYRLNNLFKGPIPRAKMRAVVLDAFRTMCAEVEAGKVKATADAIVKEKDLAIWTRTPVINWHQKLYWIKDLLEQGDTAHPALDCNDFSELIRVIGTWLENGGGFGERDITKAMRTGVENLGGATEPSRDYLAKIGEFRKKYGWAYQSRLTPDERETLARLASTKDFIKRQNDRDAKVWGKPVRQREDVSAIPSHSMHHPIEPHVIDYWVRPKAGKESGMQMFRVIDNDLCKRIDLLFGLLKGATISGTTTDTVMTLESFGVQRRLHPGYYVFPVATIAASLHHTLLEAGLALTAAGAIDSYCVGFYTTLAPAGGLPGELQDVPGILREAEEDPRNRHMVIWYEGNEEDPAGCILFDKKHEIEAYKRLVEGKGLMTHVMTVPQVPRKQDVDRLIHLMAPKLLAYLPQAFQAVHA